MTVKILVFDPVATNRIVLKVKLMSAYYDVLQAGTVVEAMHAAQAAMPDVIVAGSGVPVDEVVRLVTGLKSTEDADRAPVMVLMQAVDAQHRAALLNAGADDVMERPIDDLVLLARLRSLLRATQEARELRLREGTRQALGLAEAAAGFETPVRAVLTGGDPGATTRLAARLRSVAPGLTLRTDTSNGFLAGDERGAPDVFLVSLGHGPADPGLGLICNIRARPHLRTTPILAIASTEARDLGIAALDQGATDLVAPSATPEEIAVRLARLGRRKRTADRLRKTVQTGLHAALTDPLTGLYNRRYAIPHLQRMAEQSRETDRSFGVMIVDLDHFKQVNDRFGHAAGDAVLVETAARLGRNLRPADLLARIGGEEFLIAIPETDHARACAAADRLRTVIGGAPFDLGPAHPPLTVTASIGMTLATGRHADLPGGIDALLQSADRALYGSKAQGRNQVTLARSAA